MATRDMPGRGTHETPPNRFERLHVELDPDPDAFDDEIPRRVSTVLYRDASRSVLAQNESPDVGFRFSLNPYRGCEHGCVYCLGPDTPVLRADMTWTPIGDVKAGDELAGFDEQPAPGRTRKLRKAVVHAVWWSKRPTLRLITPRSEVVTTAEHRWLQSPDLRWSPTERLVGRLIDRIRFFAVCRPAIVRRVQALSGREVSVDPEPVCAVERGPRQDVVDIQTSTGTFYAAGLATHNCYARPTHEYLGFNAGLDFESRLMVKDDAPALLRRALRARGWQPQTVALSGNTDCYQPVERKLGITRRCLEAFAEARNPVAVVTKSALVARDVDLLAELARHRAAHVLVSVTTLDPELARRMEPRAARPERRLAAIGTLARAGVPVGVMVAPVIPGLTDAEIPGILEAAARAGARSASWVLLRLPRPVDELFAAWLAERYPLRRERVLGRIRETRAGRLSDARFGRRMRGEGEYARQIAALFAVAARRLGLDRRLPPLAVDAFRRPAAPGDQLPLL